MDRNEYIKLAQYACIKFAIYGHDAERAEWKDSELVSYGGVKYIPIAYVLTFDSTGNPVHNVKIRDVKANSEIETSLDKIHKLEEQIK